MTKIRTFKTGATRDTDENKHEYIGYISPLTLKRFAEYMTKHRKQADGNLRSSSNWKKGIPKEAYMQSLMRHIIDLWLHWDGFPEEAREDIEEALCGIIFNSSGFMHEHMKDKLYNKTKNIKTSKE